MTQPLKAALRGNLEKLQAYGARMTTSDRLQEDALRAIHSFLPGGQVPAEPSGPEPSSGSGHPTIRPAMTGKVLSVKAVNTAPQGAVIIAPKGTIVTALASDEARRRGVTIRFES